MADDLHTEFYIERKSVKFAQKQGWLVRKMQWIGRRGAVDRLFARDAIVYFVEFKKPGGKPNPQQDREHKRMRAAGLSVIVIDDLETAYALFR